MNPRTMVAIRTLLAPVAWGTTYVTITELLPSERTFFVAWMRVLPAGIALAALGLVRARHWPSRRDLRRVGLLSMFNFVLFFPLLIVAIDRLPGGVAAAAGGVQPLLVGLVTRVTTGDRMRRLDIAVGCVSAVGVALVVLRPGAGIDAIGVVAALAANLSFSIGVVATKRCGPSIDRTFSTGLQLLFAAALLGPLGLIVEGTPPALSATNLVGFGYLSLIATGAAFVLWFAGIEALPAQAPPVLGLAAPLTGAGLGWLLLGEDLSALQLLGFATTCSAITYAATLGSRANPGVEAGESTFRRRLVTH